MGQEKTLLLSIESWLFKNRILMSWFLRYSPFNCVGCHPPYTLNTRLGPFFHCSNVFPTINRRGTPRKRRRSARLKDQAMALKQALADSWISHGEKTTQTGRKKLVENVHHPKNWLEKSDVSWKRKNTTRKKRLENYIAVPEFHCRAKRSLRQRKELAMSLLCVQVYVCQFWIQLSWPDTNNACQFNWNLSETFVVKKMTWNRAFNSQLFCLLSWRFLAWVTERD